MWASPEKLPFPKIQKEYFLRTTVTSYTWVWGSDEHQASTYVTPVTKRAHILPETPLISWSDKWYNVPNCTTLHSNCAAVVPGSHEHEASRVLLGTRAFGGGAFPRVGLRERHELPVDDIGKGGRQVGFAPACAQVEQCAPVLVLLVQLSLLAQHGRPGAHCGLGLETVRHG